MPSTYTDRGRIILQATGENDGTWGALTNDSALKLIDEMVDGVTSKDISGSGSVSLTANNGATDESRKKILKLTGTLTGDRIIVTPSVEKLYIVDASGVTHGGFDLTIKTSGGAGVVFDGVDYDKGVLYCDGTDVYGIVDNEKFDPGDLALLDTVDTAQIDDDAVTNVKLAEVATSTIKGRVTTGTGVVEDLTPTQVRGVLDIYSTSEVDTLTERQFMHLQEIKSSGITGELTTVLNYNKRLLNTEVYNSVTDGSLNASLNQFTLPVGVYKVTAGGSIGGYANTNRLRIRNITDSTNDVIGLVSYSGNLTGTDSANTIGGEPAKLQGILTVSDESKTFELQHWVSTNPSSTSVQTRFGFPSNDGLSEVYADILIEKI